jgi:hypothetical protein
LPEEQLELPKSVSQVKRSIPHTDITTNRATSPHTSASREEFLLSAESAEYTYLTPNHIKITTISATKTGTMREMMLIANATTSRRDEAFERFGIPLAGVNAVYPQLCERVNNHAGNERGAQEDADADDDVQKVAPRLGELF